MSDWYKILKADPLGEPWMPSKPGAKAIQRYWCQAEGQELPLSIGRQIDNPLHPGMNVYGDLVYAKSQKGNVYWKFTSQRPPEGETRPMDAPQNPAQAVAQIAVSTEMPGWFVPVANQIKYIYDQLQAMDETRTVEEVTPENSGAEVQGKEVDAETLSMIDEMFTPTEEEV